MRDPRSPVNASSGKTQRHRLNRGGDRHANSALWTIVLTRMSNHPPTRAYVARRTAEGLSKREIIRCLGTSPSQFYRLIDPANYQKTIDQMLALLNVLGCEVEFTVRKKSA